VGMAPLTQASAVAAMAAVAAGVGGIPAMDYSGSHSGTSGRIVGHSSVTASNRVGRNAACPCGSGRKFKRCCFAKRRVSAVRRADESADSQ